MSARRCCSAIASASSKRERWLDLFAKEFLAATEPVAAAYVAICGCIKKRRTAYDIYAVFFASSREILQGTLEHIWLVAIAMLLAARSASRSASSSPKPWLSKPILGFANIAETIPSLALFGFLPPRSLAWRARGPLRHRRARPLRAAAHHPQHRSGNPGVDPAVREAARAMGMTSARFCSRSNCRSRFLDIFAGIRISTVLTIGIATIAAAVGAGGLGEFIFRGLAMVNNQLILAGAIPAALLALRPQLFCSVLERRLRPVRV